MIYVHLITLAVIFLFYLLYTYMKTKGNKGTKYLVAVFGGALLLRLILAALCPGFRSDIICFGSWADRIFLVGPAEFYSPDAFTDYPPGYMYILYPVGALRSILQIPAYSGLHLLLLKLPAILCDMLCAGLLVHVCRKRKPAFPAWVLAALYLFNPAVILNSAVWGQVDAVYTLFVALMCYFLTERKLFPAYFAFWFGVLMKPQMLVFTPVLLVGILDDLLWAKIRKAGQFFRWAMIQAGRFLCAAVAPLLMVMPFGMENVVKQYGATMSSYGYASVNAYNFWSLLGQNWASQEKTFLGITYNRWGTIVILLIVLFTFLLSLKAGKDTTKYPILAAFIILTMFSFSVRMHERYMFTGLLMLVFAFLYSPGRKLFLCYTGFTVLHFYNTVHILYFYDPYAYDASAPAIRLVSAGMMVCMFYFYHFLRQKFTGKISAKDSLIVASGKQPGKILSPKAPRRSADKVPLTRTDLILLGLIMLLYGGFALHDLGDSKAPETFHSMVEGDTITLDFGPGGSPASFSYYIAPWNDREFTVEARASEDHDWQTLEPILLDHVFTWQEIGLPYNDIRHVRLTLTSYTASLIELTFKDSEGNLLVPVNSSEYAALFDESGLCPERSSFRNSMYFDEIYHGRTAYEYLNGLYTYETTHPPLGKILISLGIALFGMNPFGWRIVGTLFGILMLPFLYLFGKRITKSTSAAALSCFLFAFDFMHFTQTRIATIDVYITFFVILMYYFMYRYCTLSFYDRPLKQTWIPLGACGITMGLGFACKWTGAYAGVGLALLFFGCLVQRYREYLYAASVPTGSTDGISHREILKRFRPYTQKTLLFCVVFFVVIPFVIYLLSYIPFKDGSGNGLLVRMLENQSGMLSYHGDLDSTHPYASSWEKWPIMVRPVWYYAGTVSETLREGISAFGNPLVWWVGIPAFLYTLYLAIRKKEGTAAFLAVAYLAQYLPWMFVSRITFMYHYFPSVPFVVLMIVYSLHNILKKLPGRRYLLCLGIYAVAAFCLFLLFYPVLSGQPVEAEFAKRYLKWFSTWVLISG